MLFVRSVTIRIYFSRVLIFIFDLKKKEIIGEKQNAREKRMFWVKVWITSPIFFRRLEIGTSFFHSLQSIFHSIREHSSIRISITFIFLIFFLPPPHSFLSFFFFLSIIRTIKGDSIYPKFLSWTLLKSSK